MSYRDDHDAALLRVAALESELALLRKTKEEAPAFKPRTRSKLPAVGLGIAACAGFVGLMAAVHFGAAAEAAPPQIDVAAPAPAPTPTPEPAPAFLGLAGLRSCMEAIAPVADSVDATSMDPRGNVQPVSLATILHSGAACRSELAKVAAGNGLSITMRERLSAWSATESDLANSISLISVYYQSNPVALDNYATAPQLWTEYHRVHHARNVAIEGLIGQL